MKIRLEYWNGEEWMEAGTFISSESAWVFLGSDNMNYRSVHVPTGEVLLNNSTERAKAQQAIAANANCDSILSND
jgi:hypothetical protein